MAIFRCGGVDVLTSAHRRQGDEAPAHLAHDQPGAPNNRLSPMYMIWHLELDFRNLGTVVIVRRSAKALRVTSADVCPADSREVHAECSERYKKYGGLGHRGLRALFSILIVVLLAASCGGETATSAAERPTSAAEPAETPAAPTETAESVASTDDTDSGVDDEPETATSTADPTPVPATDSAPDAFTTRPLGVGALGIKGDWSKLEIDGPYLETLGSFGGFFEISWCRIEEDPGDRNWTRLDRVVDDAGANNIALMIKIRVGSCWVTDGEASDSRGERERRASAMPTDMDAYNEFVTSLVGRYVDSSVVAYAIENEVNGEGFWAGTVDEFVTLSEAGARAVRSADPSVYILDSGLSSTTYGSAMAADLLAQGQEDRAIEVFNTYYERRLRRRSDFPIVTSADELRDVLSDGQAGRNVAYAQASVDLAARGVVDGYQLHFYEKYVSIPVLMEYVNRSVNSAPVHVVEAGIFWQNGDQDQLTNEMTQLVTGLFQHGATSVTFLPLRSNGEGIRWGLLDPQGDTPERAELFAEMSTAIQGPNPRIGVLPLGDRVAVIFGSDQGAVAILKDAAGQSPDFEVARGETPESLAADLT